MSFKEGWKEYKLGEDAVTKIGDGLHGTPTYDINGRYYFINGSNLVDGKIIINSSTKRVAEEEFIKYKKDLTDKTVLLGINGTIGNVAIYNNEKCILGKSAAYLNINDSFDKTFIKYLLLNNHFQNYIRNNATGTTIKNVGLGLLRAYEFLAPESLATQRRIATILSSLDEKIELNRQMNQTLEETAQTLFRQMCLPKGEELPEGWEWKTVGELVKIAIGKTPPRKESEWFSSNPSDIVWVSIKDLGQAGMFISNSSEYLLKEGVKKYNVKIVPANSVLLSFKLTLGRVAITTKELTTNEAIAHFVFNNKSIITKEFLYFYLKEFDYNSLGSTSSIATAINSKMVREIPVLIPSMQDVKNYTNIVNPIFEKIKATSNEIATLTQLRDNLLPKLMTGEIEV